MRVTTTVQTHSRPATALTRTPCTSRHPPSCRVNAVASGPDAAPSHVWTSLAAAAASLLLITSPAHAASKGLPPIVESEARCTLEALDLFAQTRAVFSQEASSGAMTEALVDVRGCDFSGKNLAGKVMSGVLLQNADFSKANFVGIQMARADARGAKLQDTDFTDVNAFATQFDGADLQGAQFENAILTNASFGKFQGEWANLKGAHFLGALLSSSDIGRLCANPTLDLETRKFELGCRGSR